MVEGYNTHMDDSTDHTLQIMEQRASINRHFESYPKLYTVCFIILIPITCISIVGFDGTSSSFPGDNDILLYIMTSIGIVSFMISGVYASIILYGIEYGDWMSNVTSRGLKCYIMLFYIIVSLICRLIGYQFVNIIDNHTTHITYWTWYLYYIGLCLVSIPSIIFIILFIIIDKLYPKLIHQEQYMYI